MKNPYQSRRKGKLSLDRISATKLRLTPLDLILGFRHCLADFYQIYVLVLVAFCSFGRAGGKEGSRSRRKAYQNRFFPNASALLNINC